MSTQPPPPDRLFDPDRVQKRENWICIKLIAPSDKSLPEGQLEWRTKDAIGAYCTACSKRIPFTPGTSVQLTRHMKANHPDLLKNFESAAGSAKRHAESQLLRATKLPRVDRVLDPESVFKVHVSKDYMKFNAAHFIAYKGFREKLHGHNYRLSVTITGVVGPDGYVIDFGDIKNISRKICKKLNESFLVPMQSDVLDIDLTEKQVSLKTECGSTFTFPKDDCSFLPIVHSSAEELAIYISNEIISEFTLEALVQRGATKLEVSIAEATNQLASFERPLKSNDEFV